MMTHDEWKAALVPLEAEYEAAIEAVASAPSSYVRDEMARVGNAQAALEEHNSTPFFLDGEMVDPVRHSLETAIKAIASRKLEVDG